MADAAERDGGESMEADVPGSDSAAPSASGDGGSRAEAGESEPDDEEDVFEVESILDSKVEGAMVLYRVRWKGYDSEGDTWEPEAHLDDCREVLLDFKYKQAEMKQKAAKKEIPKLVLSDVFEADSDSEPPSVKKDPSPDKKKKKKEEEAEETKIQEDLKKKKAKSGKSKERTKSESEPPESQSAEAKPKKRTSEGKEGLSSKKQRREDSKDYKKSKKEELKDTKVKGKEEHKEKKHKKEKPLEPEQPPAEQSEKGEVSQESVSESKSVEPASEEKGKTGQETNERSREASPEQPRELQPIEEDSDDAKMKRKKKKKHKKLKTDKGDDVKSAPTEEIPFDKKASQKKQKHLEKVKEQPPVEKAPVQKNSRQSVEEKIRKLVSMDSSVEDKDAKKPDPGKDKTKKKPDIEKEFKREPKVVKSAKEPKSTGFAFSILPGDVDEIMETSRKEKATFDHRLPDEPKSKDLKPAFKERRNTRDEADPWSFTASEGDQEVMDPVCHLQENSSTMESKSQVVGLGMDLQLEWMTLEDFQRHLEGNDEILPTETITSSALKEAVKNGDYLTVKFALNSTENYNLDQEDSSGMTLVMMAAAAGQDDLLRLLIKKGAKINARQKNGTTALIHAAEKDHLSTVALLLEAGAYVNLQQNHGETALFKACRRGNYDIVRLLIEHGTDCNVQSKHNNNALQLANGTNVILYELIKNHLETLTRVVEDAIRDYFETRLALLEPVFPIACHRLCEGPDFSLDFHYKPPPKVPEGSGILLFVFHANFFGKEVVVRLCGPCSVQAVVLNDKFQLPIFLDAHFIYSFNPINGPNKLFIRLSEVPTAKVKLLICAYRVQLQ